ncbi:MAG: serine O-acetyltransferase [Pseudomonadota bacterium]
METKTYVSEYIKSDFFRINGKLGIRRLLLASLFNRGFIYMMWFRALQSRWLIIRVVARIMVAINSRRFQIQISKEAQIGYGFFINHGMCVVIAGSAKIGNNVTISQFVTIGSMHDNAAEIGNNVYIGPSVCIVENVRIGDNVTIGAGAVVTKDIPDNVTVAGCPAKVVSTKSPGRLVYNKWPMDNP